MIIPTSKQIIPQSLYHLILEFDKNNKTNKIVGKSIIFKIFRGGDK